MSTATTKPRYVAVITEETARESGRVDVWNRDTNETVETFTIDDGTAPEWIAITAGRLLAEAGWQMAEELWRRSGGRKQRIRVIPTTDVKPNPVMILDEAAQKASDAADAHTPDTSEDYVRQAAQARSAAQLLWALRDEMRTNTPWTADIPQVRMYLEIAHTCAVTAGVDTLDIDAFLQTLKFHRK
jgi:hypothetical protein